ncbi:MAG: hypothetical protein ABH874_03055 [Methanobacteriota archaeon]
MSMEKLTQQEQLHQMLLAQYKAVKERNDDLSTRAHTLLGLDGIINTILVAIIVGVLDEKTRTFLTSSAYFSVLKIVVVLGFAMYIFSTILALFAYRTTKYMPIPQINSKEFIQEVFTEKTQLSLQHLSLQIYDAIQFYNLHNTKKYNYLFASTVFLLIAIVCTAVVGAFLFLSISR